VWNQKPCPEYPTLGLRGLGRGQLRKVSPEFRTAGLPFVEATE
jgi:hypothetical protein